MSKTERFLFTAAIGPIVAILLLMTAGCDDYYELEYDRTYVVPARTNYYYRPYVGLEYGVYEYPYRSAIVNTYYYTPYTSLGYRSCRPGLTYRRPGRGFRGPIHRGHHRRRR